MKLNELLSEYSVHRTDVRGMAPEGVVHGRERDAHLLALEGSVHHVGRVERMHEVRREGRVLLLLIYGLIVHALRHGQRLNYCRDDVLLRRRLVGLHARESQGCDPLHWLTRGGYDLRTLREPFLDAVGVSEEVANALDCYAR